MEESKEEEREKRRERISRTKRMMRKRTDWGRGLSKGFQWF